MVDENGVVVGCVIIMASSVVLDHEAKENTNEAYLRPPFRKQMLLMLLLSTLIPVTYR
jgi:hypothetical protein